MTKTKVPNPGSDAALDLGCRCPVIDNGHGNDRLGKERGFWINEECELHVAKKKDKKKDSKRTAGY